MNAVRSETEARCTQTLALVAREAESPWAARGLGDLVPPASLTEARVRRDELAALLGRERAAAADFLLALSDFDRRRGWERLGHASLFAFLTRELRLSSGAAQLRLSAARLLPRHPAVEAALRDGRLCISAVGQLARVLTSENEAEVLPRFFGRSAREALEVAAAILPAPCPPRREVVTRLPAVAARPVVAAGQASTTAASPAGPAVASSSPGVGPHPLAPTTSPGAAATGLPGALPPVASPAPTPEAFASPAPLHTYEVPSPVRPRRTPEVEPLTADLRRLHLTVSRTFTEKVAAARTGLSHALPGATTEQVLEAALDLLLDQRARRKALVKRPRRGATPSGRAGAAASASTPPSLSPTPPRPHIPAEVEREVRLRDGDRCQFPLDAGGVCGSTWRVELDHLVPVALGGPSTVANLRCACQRHNALAAERALGPAILVGTRRRRGR